jgi:hypothetical protein
MNIENPMSNIPIYKICHIRSPHDISESVATESTAAMASSLSPEYNILYVFYGDTEIPTEDGTIVNINDAFKREPDNPFFKTPYFKTMIFSDYEQNSIRENNINVVFLPEKIYPDDSIETIKKKFLNLTRDKVSLSYSELYFFCKQVKTITTQMAHDHITSNGKLEMTPVRVQNYLLNIYNHPTIGEGSCCGGEPTPISDYAKLGKPTGGANGNYTYTNIANLKLEEKHRIVNVAMGQELNIASTYEYPYAVNPFDAINADPFLEVHASEIVNTTNKMVLIDYGIMIYNTIYLVTAEDVMIYAKEINIVAPGAAPGAVPGVSRGIKLIYESYMIRVYFPYLSAYRDDTRHLPVGEGSAEASGEVDLSTIHSRETLLLNKMILFNADEKILNERFKRQTENIKLLYDIYEKRILPEQIYIDAGIRGVELMIHPETPYNQSLDAVFKMIHCSEHIPYIKYNPGKKRDNIYKLHISGISRSGRKIPYLPKSDIFRLIKTTARKKSVAIYIYHKEKDTTNIPIPILCEFYPDGSIYVKIFDVKKSFERGIIEEIIKTKVNPVLRVIKEYVEQSGFKMTLFTELYHPQIELINMEYFKQIAITRNIEIKQMIKCISSAFNEIEGSLKKGIVMRYKRVSNYNDMSSQDAYVIEMMNKRQSDRDIIEGLRDNYMMSETDARAKLSSILSSLQTQQFSRFRGGNIRIKNNPGFLTKITKGAFNNIITIEIGNINNVLFLDTLHIYIDSIIRIYQNPGTTNIPYSRIVELCANAAGSSSTASVLPTKLPPSGAVVGSDSLVSEEGAPQPFLQNERAEAVIGDIHPSDREESIEVMPEIVPVIKKPTTTASAAAASVVFGFEAEAQKEEEELDLFDLLQGNDEEEEDDGRGVGDSAPSSEQGGGAGAAQKRRPSGSATSVGAASAGAGIEEDLSDITGMDLANPNPFSKRIQERDPVIHLNEDVGKFNAYSRSCPWNVRRQPVILTNEEKERIDREHPNSYSHSISYGSDPSKQYHYICPRYWSLKDNTSLTEEEVKSGKYGAVIPSKAKKIPPGANIFEFTDDKHHVDEKGNYKQHYPGFLKKDAHPKGLCVPCCFAQWDKPSQTERRKECESKQFEAIRTEPPTAMESSSSTNVVPSSPDAGESIAPSGAAAAAVAAVAPLPVVAPSKINEMKDERILSSDKFPLEDNRWGYLPFQIQKFLFTDSRNCQVSLKNTAIKKDTPCLLRRGVETNDRQSFVSAIAYYYKESIGLTSRTVTSRENPGASSTGSGNGRSVKSNTRETISALINSESLVAEGGISRKERIKQRVQDIMNSNSTQIKKKTTSVEVAAQPNIPIQRAVAGGGGEELVEDYEYHSEDETPPVSMTPRVSSSAAAPITSVSAFGAVPSSSVVLPANAVPTIREMRNIIIESLDIDTFITLNNGTLADIFYNPKKELRDLQKYEMSKISRTLPQETFARICNAYENFISYLDDDASIIDHTYLWDIVSRPNEKLFKNGNNIILIHIPDDDITNNVQVICPTNAYSGEVFDVNRKTIIIMKRDTYYEPIYLFESKSNGKYEFTGRFSMKDKTISPKIKHIIENIRDIYFSYCRLHESQPREYRYKMNKPAHIIAKMLTDAGFTIHAQVMNFNGKVIALQISQTIRITKLNPSAVVKKTFVSKKWAGVIPTAVSAPLVNNRGLPPPPPMIMMDDDTLWEMSYNETVEFLETVANHVKKITKKDLYCRPKVKVVEEGIVVGVITETNQFIQINMNKDRQQIVDDGLPTLTENNHLHVDKDGMSILRENSHNKVDKEIGKKSEGNIDHKREKYVRNIRLETNFYNVFRNTARNVLNRPENKGIKDDIEKLIASPFTIYQNKLSQIIAHMKRILSKYISFIKYNKDTLKMVGEISGCITSDDETCGKKSYCLKESGGLCKLLLPERNLMYPNIKNEEAYFDKISDEMIRYERVKLFMFEPTKYLSFQDRKYDLVDNEIILLETFITQEYFENMEPVDENKYAFHTNFYTVAPSNAGSRGIQTYDPMYRKDYVDRYLELESSNRAREKQNQAKEVVSAPPQPEFSFQINEINHVLDFCMQVSKRKISEKLQLFFSNKDTFEIMFSNESNECSFDVILTILRIVAQNASKCPSGHTCVREVPNQYKFKSMVSEVSASDPEPERVFCQKCRESIGQERTEFACRQCNYFICENCRHQHVDELAEMTIIKLKNILIGEYDKFANMGLGKKLTMILNGYGMKKYADVINEERATLPQIIQSENYFLTNVDIWILSLYFKIPIVFISQGLLSENGKNVMVLYDDSETNSYFFIHPFAVTQNVPSRFCLIEVKHGEYSLLRIPMEFLSERLQEKIRNDEDDRISIEEYIRTYKLGNMKNKKRVFTLMEPSSAKEPA